MCLVRSKALRTSAADMMMTMQHVRHSERALRYRAVILDWFSWCLAVLTIIMALSLSLTFGSTAKIEWTRTPKNVFVLMKPGDPQVAECYRELLVYLMNEHDGLRVYLQPTAIDNAGLNNFIVNYG